MQALFATPGMTVTTLTVLVVHALSLFYMWMLLYEYRCIHLKRVGLLRALDGMDVTSQIWGRRILMWVYALLTLVILFLSLYLFVFQPHLF